MPEMSGLEASLVLIGGAVVLLLVLGLAARAAIYVLDRLWGWWG